MPSPATMSRPDVRPPPTMLEVSQQEAAAMLRAAFQLFVRWQLDGAQSRRLLGSPSERTFPRWKGGEVASIPHDTVCRLGVQVGTQRRQVRGPALQHAVECRMAAEGGTRPAYPVIAALRLGEHIAQRLV